MSWLSDAWDWVEDSAEDLWDGITDIAEDIWAAVVDVAEAVWEAVTDAWDWLVEQIEKLGDWIEDHIGWVNVALMAAAVVAVVVAWPAVSAAWSSTLASQTAAINTANGWLAQTWATVSAYGSALKAGFSAFLEAIHFKTIMSVHTIGMLVSEDYRNIMRDVYAQISEVSEALGFWPQYLNLLFRNTRTLILDAASTFGQSYDIAEITWVKRFSDYLGKFADKAGTYKDDPAMLLFDLEQWVEKPALEAKSKFMREFLSTVDSAITLIDGTVTKVVRVKDDIDRLVRDLPAVIRWEVEPVTKRLTEQLSQFIYRDYGPTMETIRKVHNRLMVTTGETKKDLDSIVKRLARPGDYISEIDLMSPADRYDQENKIAEISTRPLTRITDGLEREARPKEMRLKKLLDLLKLERPRPTWMVEEITAPARPALVPAKPRETWFVGEY